MCEQFHESMFINNWQISLQLLIHFHTYLSEYKEEQIYLVANDRDQYSIEKNSHVCCHLPPIFPIKFSLEWYLAPINLSQYSHHTCKYHVFYWYFFTFDDNLTNTISHIQSLLTRRNKIPQISTSTITHKTNIEEKADVHTDNHDKLKHSIPNDNTFINNNLDILLENIITTNWSTQKRNYDEQLSQYNSKLLER